MEKPHIFRENTEDLRHLFIPNLISHIMEVEELRGPFDTIIRRFRQTAQDLEEKGQNDEAQQFYMNAEKVKNIKEEVLRG